MPSHFYSCAAKDNICIPSTTIFFLSLYTSAFAHKYWPEGNHPLPWHVGKLLQKQPAIQFVPIAIRTHCCNTFNCCPPVPFLQHCSLACQTHLICFLGLFCNRWRTSHLPLLNSIEFPPPCVSSLTRSLQVAALSSSRLWGAIWRPLAQDSLPLQVSGKQRWNYITV